MSDNCGMDCSTPKLKLKVTGPNPALITLPNVLIPTILFAASETLTDAGVYTVSV